MNVIVSSEADETNSGCYHLLRGGEEPSCLCGAIDVENASSSNSVKIMSMSKAEERGFNLCMRCEGIAQGPFQ